MDRVLYGGTKRSQDLRVQLEFAGGRQVRKAVGDKRFRPYVQLHEFEALMFVDAALAAARAGEPGVGRMIESAVVSSGGAELVNEGPTTAPSKRIKASSPGYVKTIDGPALAGAIGLTNLAHACPHFAEWIHWLESHGQRPG